MDHDEISKQKHSLDEERQRNTASPSRECDSSTTASDGAVPQPISALIAIPHRFHRPTTPYARPSVRQPYPQSPDSPALPDSAGLPQLRSILKPCPSCTSTSPAFRSNTAHGSAL